MGSYIELVSVDDLRRIMPGTAARVREMYAPYLNQALGEYEINTKRRIAGFIGQMAPETLSMNWMIEHISRAAATANYELKRRKAVELGNTEPGDGWRYIGRGALQLTGRKNYRRIGDALNVDFESDPDLVLNVDWLFRSGAMFWQLGNGNAFADVEDWRGLTRSVNGGYTQLADRIRFSQVAMNVLPEHQEATGQ